MTMFKKYFTLIASVLTVILVSSCVANLEKQDLALQALKSFFKELARGEYEAASALYDGSYESLISFNPELNPDNHATLWQTGCQLNGLKCLTVRSATFTEVNEAGEFVFTVEFNAPDGGGLFTLWPCCGEDPNAPTQSQFEYRVVEGEDGQFRVLDLPVYTP